MEIRFNVTGQERKALVAAVCEIVGEPTKYMGAPSFAYTVGEYAIDRTGTLTSGGSIADETNSRLLKELNVRGLIGEVPDRGDSEEAASKEPTIDKLVIQMPRTGFAPEKLENLAKLVRAKAPLLKAALDADDLPIQQTADTLDFPWFRFTEDSETVKTYSILISLLCKAAKEKKRVTAKECAMTNPKYAMRCFLLSLGFIGAEYKTARKILLSRLEGNSSWKSKDSTEGSDDNA